MMKTLEQIRDRRLTVPLTASLSASAAAREQSGGKAVIPLKEGKIECNITSDLGIR